MNRGYFLQVSRLRQSCSVLPIRYSNTEKNGKQSLLSTEVFHCAIINPLPTHGSPLTQPCVSHWNTKNKSRFLLWKDDDEARLPDFWKA